jgi:hypothetical protein
MGDCSDDDIEVIEYLSALNPKSRLCIQKCAHNDS